MDIAALTMVLRCAVVMEPEEETLPLEMEPEELEELEELPELELEELDELEDEEPELELVVVLWT
jgi:hypothetical protein